MRFNRTFMELKPNNAKVAENANNGFNRTFMELKQTLNDARLQQLNVLIGPSWN